jgi:DNA-binding transcriptional ArsR family regulator
MTAPTPDVFAALAHPVRRRILELLRARPRTSGEITAAFELSRPAVAEHLQALRLAGLVHEEARGRQRIYHIEGAGLVSAREWLRPFELNWRRRMRTVADIADKEDT